MYLDDYKRWMDTELEDPALTEELQACAACWEQDLTV